MRSIIATIVLFLSAAVTAVPASLGDGHLVVPTRVELMARDMAVHAERGYSATAVGFPGYDCQGPAIHLWNPRTSSHQYCYSPTTGETVNSIKVTGSGCKTQTWPDYNCGGGNPFLITNSECNQVKYRSISFDC